MDLHAFRGIVAVNKPVGPTSHDIIDPLRELTGEKRIGHAGTLDPLASGVLVVGIGREATRQLGEIVQHEKEYRAIIKLGEYSSTDDGEGEKTPVVHSGQPSEEQIRETLSEFVGQIQQVPPIYSALKIQGRKAYELARSGKPPEMTARMVELKSINLESYNFPQLEVRVVCGPGVYIRALARDIGEKLETGGYLSGLQRTRVGQYSLAEAIEV